MASKNPFLANDKKRQEEEAKQRKKMEERIAKRKTAAGESPGSRSTTVTTPLRLGTDFHALTGRFSHLCALYFGYHSCWVSKIPCNRCHLRLPLRASC